MDIRNFRRKKKWKKIFALLFVFIVALILFYQIKNLWNNSSSEIRTWELLWSWQTVVVHNKWDKIRFAWTLSVDNHFPSYTHTMEGNNQKIGVKSTSINLNNHLGEIEIVGIIEDFDKGFPIVDINIIKLSKPWLIIKWNIYLFIKDLLYFDFSDQNQLSASKSWKDISVYFDNAPIFDVERFLCSKILTDKDCNSIVETYLNSQKAFFTTSWGYAFYKHAEKTWTVFDGNIFGYMFKNVEDDTLLDISNMIRIVNKDFVLSNKQDIIYEQCKNQTDWLKKITYSKVWFTDPYFLAFTAEGTSKSNKNCSCTVTFDLRDERNPIKTIFEVK